MNVPRCETGYFLFQKKNSKNVWWNKNKPYLCKRNQVIRT